MPFITRAAIVALRKHPIVNAAIQGDAILYNKNINIGVAVALDWGLNCAGHQADGGAAASSASRRAIVDVAERARSKKLGAGWGLSGGTFTLTKLRYLRRAVRHPDHQPATGSYSGHRRTQQRLRCLRIRTATTRSAIRNNPALHRCLGFDHRIVDGADAGKFMSDFKAYLENLVKKNIPDKFRFIHKGAQRQTQVCRALFISREKLQKSFGFEHQLHRFFRRGSKPPTDAPSSVPCAGDASRTGVA